MPTALKLDHRKPIIYKLALQKETYTIRQAAYLKAVAEIYQSLKDQRQTIQALVKHHLRLSNQDTLLLIQRVNGFVAALMSIYLSRHDRPFYLRFTDLRATWIRASLWIKEEVAK